MKKKLLFTALTLGATLTLNAQDVTNGLVSKYTFDNDSIQDVVGDNNGTAEFETYNIGYGGSGKCISFDGNDGSQMATISKGTIEDSIVAFDQDLSISFWFRLNNYNSGFPRNILSSRRTQTGAESGGIEFLLRASPSNTLQVSGRSISGGLTLEYNIESNTIQTNQWYFVTFTQLGSVQSLYLNGSLIGEDLTLNMAEQCNFWAVGASFRGNEAGREFNGDIDEVRFYNRALSSVEVTQLYNFDPSTADIENNILSADVSVYPNPAQDFLTISSESKVKEVQILSADGNLVLSGSNSNAIDVSMLNTGMYFVQCTLENGQKLMKKFIKN